MAKIEITRIELVWPGKYNEDGTLKEVPCVSLPFQVIERVNESRATREAKKGQTLSLFDVYEGKEGDTFEAGWRNKLIWGDNLLVMGSLLEKFAGKIDLIYIDPPFATEADFSFTAPIGESGEKVFKEQSVIEEKAYRDTWGAGRSSFMSMMADRARLMRDLLSPKGSIYVHLDWRVGPYVKALLDEVFGEENFRNEVIWYYSGGGASREHWARKHNNIYFYSGGGKWTFNVDEVRQAYKWVDGQKRADGSPRDLDRGKLPDDVIEIHGIMPWAGEKTGFETQKPEALVERFVKASSNPGDLVADFFCGSGTTLAVAEKLGRRWIGCDLGRWAIHVTRKRLLGIDNCKPFEVLNLGKYERQYWQGVTFGDKRDKSVTEQKLYEYLAFILKLYGAQPVAGMAHLHGRKGKGMVHIGAVDAPVTIDEVNQALDECVALKQTELHVLGWEWEMGLAEPSGKVRDGSLIHEVARQHGVKLVLLQIPREVMESQAAAKGDVRFLELAYFAVKISRLEKQTVQVEITDFARPNADLIPESIRNKVGKWSDYIDYWSVDWDFQNDAFMMGWVAYRTRKARKLLLVSDPHTYEKPGRYRIFVKVVDIFCTESLRIIDVDLDAEPSYQLECQPDRRKLPPEPAGAETGG
jgi:DNA modification methylase